MNNSDTNQKTPQQWLKMATIPLLLLVLFAVLCWPSQESDAAVEPVALSTDVPTTITAPSTQPIRSKWPTARLEDVIAFSPFEPQPKAEAEQVDELALLESFSEPADVRTPKSDQPSKAAAVPRQIPAGTLQAIYFDTHGAAAILNSKVFRVGDTLPNGSRIAEITAKGLRLEGS